MGSKSEKTTAGGSFLVEDIPLGDVFTPEDFTSEHKDIARAVEEFVKGEIISRSDEIETVSNQLSRDLMRKAGELGFLGIDIPEKHGGMELDKISSAIVTEKFAYGSGSFTVTEINHTGIGTLPVFLFGTKAQKEKYLPGLCSGERIGAFALTESEAGSDALNPLTSATLSADAKYYLLNGSKQFITNAGFADLIFTYAKVDGKFFTAFIVEQNWEGVSIDEEEEKMGMHGTSTRAYHFDNVKVPMENVLGQVGRGHVVALNALNMGRFKVGANSIGSSKAAFTEAVTYAKQRVQFGRRICEFGLIKEKISEMAIRLFAAESMMYRTAGLIQTALEDINTSTDDAGIKTAGVLEEYLIECSIIKIYGSEAEDYVVDEEVQIHGGYGYIRGNHPELAYRNARINRIWEGTNEINRLAIVNALMRRITKGSFDVPKLRDHVFEDIEKLRPVAFDEKENLDAQRKLMRAAKDVGLLVFILAFQKHEKELRDEQELIGMLSDIIIENYVMESTLLRAQKILKGKDLDAASIPISMSKVLFHDSINKIHFLATKALETLEDEGLLQEHLGVIKRLLVSPPINTVALRRVIADSMVGHGQYYV